MDLLKAAALAGLLIIVVRLLPDGLPDSISGPAYVIDGDSIEVLGSTIRLAGIDAPEGPQTCVRADRVWGCGEAAADALRRQIAGSRILCRPESIDRYQRYLAECFVGDLSLNEWMVEQGWAVSFGAYAAQEQAARKAGRALWSSTFDRPADWRKARGI